MTKPHQTYLDPPQITASADLRYLLIDTLKILLQQTHHTLITPPKPTLRPRNLPQQSTIFSKKIN